VEYEYVDYGVEGEVAIIRMDRFEERRNSLSRGLRRDLARALLRFGGDDALRVAVLTGTRSAFCTGADLKEAKERGALPAEERRAQEEADRLEAPLPETLLVEESVPKPVIAAVNGYAAGGGVTLAMRCDLKVAAQSATFWMPETAIGWGGPVSLWVDPLLPHAAAMEISLSQYITAQRAYELGLVNRVVPDAQLMDTALALARSIASLPPLSTRIAVSKVRERRQLEFDEVRARLGTHPDRQRAQAEVAQTLSAFAAGKRPAGPKA
jgi:enoyl-CoA hydratase